MNCDSIALTMVNWFFLNHHRVHMAFVNTSLYSFGKYEFGKFAFLASQLSALLRWSLCNWPSPKAKVDFLCLDVCDPLGQIHSSIQKEVYGEGCTRTTFTSGNVVCGYSWAFIERTAPRDSLSTDPTKEPWPGGTGPVNYELSFTLPSLGLLSLCSQDFPSLCASMSVCQCVSLIEGWADFTTPSHPQREYQRSPTSNHLLLSHRHSLQDLWPTAWPLSPKNTTRGYLRSISWPDVSKTFKDSDWL